MDHPWKLNLTVRSLILAGIVAVTSLPGDGAGAEPQPEPAAEKGVAGSDGPADSPETRVATVLGRDVLRKDLEPPPKWLEDREKHLKLHGETPGLVPLDIYRMNKLHEAVWEPLRQKYIPKQDVEPTEAELHEFIAHLRQDKARIQQERRERLNRLRAEADRLEKQLPTLDGQAREKALQRRDEIRKEIGSIEKSLEIDRSIERKGKDFEQFFAKWWVAHWKQQRWFYRRYGGRVIYQQAGPEAVDAMRDFLKEAEAKNDFVIHDPKWKAQFWAPYLRETPGTVVPNADRVFEHP